MIVTSIRIRNVLGIAEASLECGRLTTIRGRNGSTKSSVLEALKAGLGGGDLAKLKKVGATEDPEVVLVLDAGRYRIEKHGGETATVKARVGDTAAYEDMKRPQTWLDSLFDPKLSNPVRFLTAPTSERAGMLLEVLPLKLDRAALAAKLAPAWPAERVPVDRFMPDAHPLELLASAHEILFDERTGVNRTQKDKASSAYELQKALPAEMPAAPTAELARTVAERDKVWQQITTIKATAEQACATAERLAEAACDQEIARYRADFKAMAAKLRSEQADAAAEMRAEVERNVTAMLAAMESAIETKRQQGEGNIAQAEAILEQSRAAADTARKTAFSEAAYLENDLQRLNTDAGALAAQEKEHARLLDAKALADKFVAEAASLSEVADRLTAGIESIAAERMALAKDLPIDGLEVRGKTIFVNDVPFDQLNTSQRIHIAVKVATLRARTQVLPVLFVDGAEALDTEQFRILMAELEEAGVQAFVARVEDSDLTVEARSGKPEAAAAPVLSQAGPRQRSLIE